MGHRAQAILSEHRPVAPEQTESSADAPSFVVLLVPAWIIVELLFQSIVLQQDVRVLWQLT
jgi:hypothetical protein